ncbi:4-hydroxy-tetrahydrodipicolinate reductase [Halodesulfurarchaeum sp.]|uniref:4-hydroxy-tetrahydrodipicolinate reductase n=1 Tax=Halodesulfurarchaeum sp. TaxID=1980530 RepID=UPI001BBBFA1A|nr:4-hydroxy-tetrahydrodipicolinate reductase [Halodesulfurarchaeum sp.]
MSGGPTADPLEIGVTGASGRMGQEVRDVATERGMEIAFAVNRDADPQLDDVEPARRFERLVKETRPDVVIDFTGPESCVEYVTDAAEAEVPVVTGTTGFNAEQLEAIKAAGERIPILLGANFARGVQALIDAVESAVNALPEYDVELTETHHNGKRDAPSGTASLVLDRIEAARDVPSDRVYGRVGDAKRETGEIGVHARRAGDVTGEHEVLLAGNRETVSLTHRAGSRSVFAEGALDAAGWLETQPTGFYRFADVASQLTDTGDDQ